MRMSGKRKRITENNIKTALPERPDEEIERILIGSYENLGIALVEIATLNRLSEEDLRKQIVYKDEGMIPAAAAKGRGVLLMSGHFGNWEFLAYTAGLYHKLPVTIVVKPQKNRIADRLINRYRTRAGNKVVEMKKAARAIVSALKKGEAVAMLADQSATKDKDLFVDFFGRPASTYEAPAALALKFRCPIIMGFCLRQSDGTYLVETIELPFDDLDDSKSSVEELTRRHVKALEDKIRERPELWAWQHRRWKHSPVKVRSI